jgi:hypothetical protein
MKCCACSEKSRQGAVTGASVRIAMPFVLIATPVHPVLGRWRGPPQVMGPAWSGGGSRAEGQKPDRASSDTARTYALYRPGRSSSVKLWPHLRNCCAEVRFPWIVILVQYRCLPQTGRNSPGSVSTLAPSFPGSMGSAALEQIVSAFGKRVRAGLV